MYSRIVIFGRPGSGKSTFALKLHKKTGLPLYHLDKYFFVANWQERNYQEYLMKEKELIAQDRWIIDGNALQSLEGRFARADVVLYFNFPRYKCLWNIIKRLFKKDPCIQDRAQGCHEKLTWNLLWYMWTFEYRKNKQFLQQLSEFKKRYPKVKFIEVRNEAEAERIFDFL